MALPNQSELTAALEEAIEDMEKLNSIVNGNDTDEILTDNGLVPSVSNFYNQVAQVVITGAIPRKAVALATTGNITLSGEQTVDGTLTSVSDVAVTAQSLPAENGVYTTAAGAWTRRADMNEASEIARSTFGMTPIDDARSVGGAEILTAFPFASNPLKSLNMLSFPDTYGVSYFIAMSYIASTARFS